MKSDTEAMRVIMQENDSAIRAALTELEEQLLEIILDVKKYGSSEQINAVRAMLHNAVSKIND